MKLEEGLEVIINPTDENPTDEKKTEQGTVREAPVLSLRQFAKFCVGSERAKNRILINSKYPPNYFPKYYVRAAKTLQGALAANIDNETTFEDLARRAVELEKDAKYFPPNKDDHRNRYYSAQALHGIVKMQDSISKILDRYTIGTNHFKLSSLVVSDVRINAKADLLLFEPFGSEEIGFLTLNYTKGPLKELEAYLQLFVIREVFKKAYGKDFSPGHCVLIDPAGNKTYCLKDADVGFIDLLETACSEINRKWHVL